MQKVSATAKYIKISPQKMRVVADEIKKLSPEEAINVLAFVNKSASPVLVKVIKSALANAQNNSGLTKESLKFNQILISKGPMSKRFRPVSRGRAHQILKRTSHVTIILEGEQKTSSPKTETTSKNEVEVESQKEKEIKTQPRRKNGTKN